ncbi:hypothetical protein PDESU_03334 [Pontiella desulfatans]|uniref:Uncharacterized protein n=1 Tax=Pontiella desulfatans TaxID=2750659 RepID=A0A6C2U4E0_PONDE|nr:hypothetical protein [Pontiella desulfatans]VGO14765.1 hypothetical protein PDESU_03334 [Pontiella desulfatans]
MSRARSNGFAAPIVVVEVGLKCHKPPGRPLEVGERFRSIAWAECSTGIGRAHIIAQLSGRAPQARGVRFEYLNGENK